MSKLAALVPASARLTEALVRVWGHDSARAALKAAAVSASPWSEAALLTALVLFEGIKVLGLPSMAWS